jgi:adenylate cyclase
VSDPLHSWLLREGSDCAHLLELAGKLGEQLLAAGLPCARVWISTMRPHPLLAAQAVEWTDSGSLTRRDVPLARRSEIRVTGGPFDDAFDVEIFRIHLRDLPIGHSGLNRGLWESGYTEMAGIGLLDGARRLALCTFATRQPGGWTPDQITLIHALRLPLRVVIQSLERGAMTRTLADTYLGKSVAQRVIDGAMHRGDGESVPAVLWFSDLRGFTRLSEQLPLPALLALLDDAFEAQVAAIEAHGGDVLKFIGDGLLALFRVDSFASATAACTAAITASREFAVNLAGVNHQRETDGAPLIRYGLALHLGDVMYGNIGSRARLDFTVIGSAVNVAARLEALSAGLGSPLVVSAEFAAEHPEDFVLAGSFPLKGVQEPVAAYVPRH